MENLNKENFWNELYKKYPKGMKRFCDWIDEYKKQVDWDWIFVNPGGNKEYQTKFHTIPIEMQLGLIDKFLEDNRLYICKNKDIDADEWIAWIKSSDDENCEFPQFNGKRLIDSLKPVIECAIDYLNI